MLNRLSERKMHVVRWLLAIGWLLLIASLFYDPLTAYLTEPTTLLSPFRIQPESAIDPTCVQVQGVCLPEQPYSMTARIFWAMIVPAGLLIIFVFGHEFWRRICPLSFFSQIPKALGIQRKRKVVNPTTGKTHYELISVEKRSWLGRNFLYLQFAFLWLGLVIRILFVNSDRLALGIFLILTILAAMLVGYLYAGKSWCQYFCPMAPVQMVYTGPRGLLGSQAHLGQQHGITQSICREVNPKTGQEKSACVGCQSPCIDIDAERSYWDGVTRPDRRFVYYGYIGLVVGFYFYYFLYSGNWKYYFSGAWTHEENQLSTLFSPGFYLWQQAIPIPKLIAVPLTLAVAVILACWLFSFLEHLYRNYLHQRKLNLDNEQIAHQVLTVCTFVAWNLFWIFGSRPNLAVLPEWAERFFTGLVMLVSGVWFYRTFWRSSEQYSREGIANTLRRQLNKQGLDVSKILNRSNEELKPDEVYVLAKVLPIINQTQKLELYKGVVQGALKDGIITSAESELLEELQAGLGISTNEHYNILADLGIEDPSLFDTNQSVSLENQLRLDGYRQSLESLIFDLIGRGTPIPEALERKHDRIAALKQNYRITDEEQERILNTVFGRASGVLKNAELLLQQFQVMAVRQQALQQLPANPEAPVYVLLRLAIGDRQSLVLQRLLSILEILEHSPEAKELAHQMSSTIAAPLLSNGLNAEDKNGRSWQTTLAPQILAILESPSQSVPSTLPAITLSSVLSAILYEDLEPLVRALSLYAGYLVDASAACRAAQELLETNQPGLLEETAQKILQHDPAFPPLKPGGQTLTTLDKLFCLSESHFFNQLPLTVLLDVAVSCQSRVYRRGSMICRMGDRSQEVLILFDGQADVQIKRNDGSEQTVNRINKGETIGELGVLTRAPRSATVVASTDPTMVLVLDAQRLEFLLKRNPELAIGLLAIISKRLQTLTKLAESLGK
ncbi:cyclic nucleotide-binding domain-containing protein (plasmid) [Kovacikia minuta CCNUW1]|uniref:cyclic nucleotide-binding domain-containing protein n=1 Tax=Kovacikia minuta TaxID=2931930 RepID=UPI001CD02D90|nr:cyclic nucleotide-binding domain-containing protein [Kovacikia minuta]UBF30561.1 cyclic nucleotide-binding domain-containing protein [Kovacikia minuta CCNUW1]